MMTIALAIWAIGAVMLLARVIGARVSAANIVRRSIVLDDAEWRADAARTAAHFGVTRAIDVRATDAVAVPAVVGIRRPVLLVPMDADEWTTDVRHLVLMHEIAHVARWDALGQLASQVCCAVYWCVPPVWIAASRAAALREQATDDAVLRAGVRPSTYAASLIDLANAVAGRRVNAASLAMSASRIQDRVAAILDPAARRTRTSRIAGAVLFLTASAGVAVVAAVTPEAQTFNLAVPISAPHSLHSPESPNSPDSLHSRDSRDSRDSHVSSQWPPMTAVPPVPPEPPMPPTPAMPAPAAPAAPPAPLAPMASLAPSAPLAPPAPMTPPAPMAPLASAAPSAPAAPAPPVPARAPMAPPSLPAPPAPPAPMAAGAGRSMSYAASDRASAICPNGRTSMENSSNSRNGDVTWRMKVSGAGCTVEITSHGKVEFNDAFTDIARISNDGDFRASVSRGGDTRVLVVESRGGSLTRDYKVNGASKPFDAAWFSEFLIALDREFGIGVDQRLPMLLKQGGVAGVLKETAQMPSDYARDRYYQKLASTKTLSSSEAAQVLEQAASMETSDYYAAELLHRMGPTLGDSGPGSKAAQQLLARLSSDYYIVEGLKGFYGGRRMSASEASFAADMTARIRSDYYKYELLRAVLSRAGADAPADAFGPMLNTMKEDYYIGEAIRALADHGLTSSGRRAAIDAVRRMRSSYYASEAIMRLAADSKLSEQDRQGLVDAANGIREDYYREQALRKIRR